MVKRRPVATAADVIAQVSAAPAGRRRRAGYSLPAALGLLSISAAPRGTRRPDRDWLAQTQIEV
jgi:hypothetical protein